MNLPDRRRHALGLVLLVALVSCSPWERANDTFPSRIGRDMDHDRWTRDARVYGDMETVALFSATMLSGAMTTQLQTLVQQETPGRAPKEILGFPVKTTRATFVLIASAPEPAWRRMAPPRSPWAIHGSLGGRDLPAKRIDRFKPTVGFERYFPAWNPWSSAWLVTFAAPPGALDADVGLTLSAVGGKVARLSWP